MHFLNFQGEKNKGAFPGERISIELPSGKGLSAYILSGDLNNALALSATYTCIENNIIRCIIPSTMVTALLKLRGIVLAVRS